jgi:hypothetical protein
MPVSRMPAGRGTTIVCASYDLSSGSKSGKLLLRACCQVSGQRETKSETTLKRLKTDAGEMRIGATRDGKFYWNGPIRHLTIGPDGMSANKWKAISDVVDAAPNPMNHNALDLALLRLDRR